MSDIISDVVKTLRTAGWTVVINEVARQGPLPTPVLKHGSIPDLYEAFLRRVVRCLRSDETSWFWNWDDFSEQPQPVIADFTWNDFERRGLNVAASDASWAAEIGRFWQAHLPIMMSVLGDYGYLALVTSGNGAGTIVSAFEPDAERPAVLFSTFEKLLQSLSAGEAITTSKVTPSFF